MINLQDVGQRLSVGEQHTMAAKNRQFNDKPNCQFGETKTAIEPISNRSLKTFYVQAIQREELMRVK